jgi:hypothetical protein
VGSKTVIAAFNVLTKIKASSALGVKGSPSAVFLIAIALTTTGNSKIWKSHTQHYSIQFQPVPRPKTLKLKSQKMLPNRVLNAYLLIKELLLAAPLPYEVLLPQSSTIGK